MDEANERAGAPGGRTSSFLIGREPQVAVIDSWISALAERAAAPPLVFVGRHEVGVSTMLQEVAAKAESRGMFCGATGAFDDESVRDVLARGLARAVTAFGASRPGSSAVVAASAAIAAFCPELSADLPGVIDETFAWSVARGDLARDIRRLLAQLDDAFRDALDVSLVVVLDDLHRVGFDDGVVLMRALAQYAAGPACVGFGVGGTPTLGWFARSASVAPVPGDIDPLERDAVGELLRARHGFDDAAVDAIMRRSAGYAGLVLRYGDAARLEAKGGVVGAVEVNAGAAAMRQRLERDVLAPAFAMENSWRRYVRAVAELPDAVSSADVARRLGDADIFGDEITPLTVVRDALIRRGVLSTIDGDHLSFAHPAARSYVLTWA